MQLGGQLEDPRLAGSLQWPAAAEEDPSKLELKSLQAAAAPQFKVGGGVQAWAAGLAGNVLR